MANSTTSFSGRQITRTVLYGLASSGLYLALFLLQDWLIRLSSQGGWYFLIPVGIAFLFSYVHGGFTAHFWDVLGIKARK